MGSCTSLSGLEMPDIGTTDAANTIDPTLERASAVLAKRVMDRLKQPIFCTGCGTQVEDDFSTATFFMLEPDTDGNCRFRFRRTAAVVCGKTRKKCWKLRCQANDLCEVQRRVILLQGVLGGALEVRCSTDLCALKCCSNYKLGGSKLKALPSKPLHNQRTHKAKCRPQTNRDD